MPSRVGMPDGFGAMEDDLEIGVVGLLDEVVTAGLEEAGLLGVGATTGMVAGLETEDDTPGADGEDPVPHFPKSGSQPIPQ